MAKRKLPTKKYIEFFSAFTGHSKAYVQRNIYPGYNDMHEFSTGMQKYIAWVVNGRIYCQHFIGGGCSGAVYCDIDTFEYDYELMERDQESNIQSIIANYVADQS